MLYNRLLVPKMCFIRSSIIIFPLQGECGNHTHPNGDMLRSQRVRFYAMPRKLNEECVGSSVYSLETYLIVDNATEADAGVYVVNVQDIGQVASLDDQVNVTVGKSIH